MRPSIEIFKSHKKCNEKMFIILKSNLPQNIKILQLQRAIADGANVQIKNESNKSLLDVAVENQELLVIEFIVKQLSIAEASSYEDETTIPDVLLSLVNEYIDQMEQKILKYKNTHHNSSLPKFSLALNSDVIESTLKMGNSVKKTIDQINKKTKASNILIWFKDTSKEFLVRTAVHLYQHFEWQFNEVFNSDGQYGIENLVKDAVARTMKYLNSEMENNREPEHSPESLCKAIVLSEPKSWIPFRDELMSWLGNNKVHRTLGWKSSELYSCTGILITNEYGYTKYYQHYMSSKETGYRCRFQWEIDSWANESRKYKQINPPKYFCYGKKSLNIEHAVHELLDTLDQFRISKLNLERIDFRVPAPINKPSVMRISPINGSWSDWFHKRLNATNQIIVIHGLPGVGKSEIVKQYIEAYADEYDGCIWIDGASFSTISNSFKDLARINLKLKYKSDLFAETYDALKNHKILFVFVNVTDVDVLNTCLSSCQRHFFIITTALSEWYHDRKKLITAVVDNFTESESRQFIMNYLPHSENQHTIGSLAKLCFNNPLKLRLAVAQIKCNQKRWMKRNRSYSIANYLEENKSIHIRDTSEIQQISNHLEAIWQLKFNCIRANKYFGENAMKMLCLIAFCTNLNIPEDLFRIEFGNDIEYITDFLKQHSLVDIENNMIDVHTIVQDSIIQSLSAKEILEHLDIILSILEPHMKSRVSAHIYKPHIISVWSTAYKFPELIEKYIFCSNLRMKKYQPFTTFIHIISAIPNPVVLQTIINTKGFTKNIFDTKMADNSLPLHAAAHESTLPVIKILLEYVINDINALTTSNHTPLHFVVINNKAPVAIAAKLIDAGADVNLKNKFNCTALHYAVLRNDLELVELLLKAKSFVDAKNNKDLTPLLMAVKFNRTEIAAVLLSFNANVNCADNEKNTPLHWACRNENIKMLNLLLTACPDPMFNPCNDAGRTVFHEAVSGSNSRIISILFKIDKFLQFINVQCKKGETALHIAVSKNCRGCCYLLLINGADRNVFDKSENKAPVHLIDDEIIKKIFDMIE